MTYLSAWPWMLILRVCIYWQIMNGWPQVHWLLQWQGHPLTAESPASSHTVYPQHPLWHQSWVEYLKPKQKHSTADNYSPPNSLVKGWFHTQAEEGEERLPKQVWDRRVKCFNLATSSNYLATTTWIESIRECSPTIRNDPVFVHCCEVIRGGAWSNFPSKCVGILGGRCGRAVGGRSCNIHEEWGGALCICVNEINSMVSDNICEVVFSVVVTMRLRFAIVGDCIVVVLTVVWNRRQVTRKKAIHMQGKHYQ